MKVSSENLPIFDEISEVLRKVKLRGECRRVVVENLGEHLEVRAAVLVGKLSSSQLHEGDAETPHVSSDVVVRVAGVGGVNTLGLR